MDGHQNPTENEVQTMHFVRRPSGSPRNLKLNLSTWAKKEGGGVKTIVKKKTIRKSLRNQSFIKYTSLLPAFEFHDEK